MNFKKLLVTGAAAAMVFGSAAGVFAGGHHNRPNPTPTPLPTITVTNYGGIGNTAVNVANTGLNYTTGSQAVLTLDKKHGHGRKDPKDPGVSVTTGDASAYQTVDNEINTFSTCGCTTGGANTTVYNNGGVDNLSVNVANTGLNWTTGGSLTTGGATAGQDVTNVINTSVGAF